MNSANLPGDFSLLTDLLSIDSPSGDEHRMADYLKGIIEHLAPDAVVNSVGSSLIAQRGQTPNIAIFAHIDTTGFTLGYDRKLIPIGGPAPKNGDLLRRIGWPNEPFEIETDRRNWKLKGEAEAIPGDRLVYAAPPVYDGHTLTSPYLDNRAGIWAALEALHRCDSVLVAFTSGEEQSGNGARACARYLFQDKGIERALISDITWDTEHVHIGAGPALSLRDDSVPNQRYVEEVTQLAAASGLTHQIEIESDGGSDGAHIDRGSFPIDWMFVGAPEKSPHSSHESISLIDLAGMADLLVYLVNQLSPAPGT